MFFDFMQNASERYVLDGLLILFAIQFTLICNIDFRLATTHIPHSNRMLVKFMTYIFDIFIFVVHF
jgi:hypothetical protein